MALNIYAPKSDSKTRHQSVSIDLQNFLWQETSWASSTVDKSYINMKILSKARIYGPSSLLITKLGQFAGVKAP